MAARMSAATALQTRTATLPNLNHHLLAQRRNPPAHQMIAHASKHGKIGGAPPPLSEGREAYSAGALQLQLRDRYSPGYGELVSADQIHR